MSVSRNNELLRANQSYSTNGFSISCPLPWVQFTRGWDFCFGDVTRDFHRGSESQSTLTFVNPLIEFCSLAHSLKSRDFLKSLLFSFFFSHFI
jgi:hypothetical protein